jgi:hypothetical protein
MTPSRLAAARGSLTTAVVPLGELRATAAGLPGCASGGSAGAGAASRLMPASYAFEFSVQSVRRIRGMIEPYERVVAGSIMVDTATTLEVRLGRTQDERTWDCRVNVARQFIRAGSTQRSTPSPSWLTPSAVTS